MSVTTVDVEKLRSVVKAVIEDWIRSHGYTVSVSGYDLDELYRMLMEELRSVHVNDAPWISINMVSHDVATISVHLPINKVMCEARFTAGNIKVYGDRITPPGFISVTAELKSPVEVECFTSRG